MDCPGKINLANLYPGDIEVQKRRYGTLTDEFIRNFGETADISYFSAPGRTEIAGNHTDHNNGKVLAAAVDMDVIAAACKTSGNIIRLRSKGHEPNYTDLSELSPLPDESGRSNALIRGICARFSQLGYNIGGFDAVTDTDVTSGSGLSSSAAFEVLVCTILNHFYNDASIDPLIIAQISQYAENNFFMKPCGLMDQTACSRGGFVEIDFYRSDLPVVRSIEYDLKKSGYVLMITHTGGNHADLTDDYASVPAEMRQTAALFGKETLAGVGEKDFYSGLADVRGKISDRALLRTMHFFDENRRVEQMSQALSDSNFPLFLDLVRESGRSSFQLLQNCYSINDPSSQAIPLALAVSEGLLDGQGAVRVHGGGFAGTIQAYVPENMTAYYLSGMEKIFGAGNVRKLSIRNYGGVAVCYDRTEVTP